ncbi:MAG: hypothetical protein Q8918_19555 [Bacteroidota bacterium]|nr:hypothetical protein [Bacteroidota bacterium]
MIIWNALGIIALIILIFFLFKRKNAVTMAFAVGILVALIAGLVYYFNGEGFNWPIAEKVLILSIFTGALYRLVTFLKNKTRART